MGSEITDCLSIDSSGNAINLPIDLNLLKQQTILKGFHVVPAMLKTLNRYTYQQCSDKNLNRLTGQSNLSYLTILLRNCFIFGIFLPLVNTSAFKRAFPQINDYCCLSCG